MIDDFRSLAPTYRPTPASCTEGAEEPVIGVQSIWVSGYTRTDGKKVEGYYKKNPAHQGASP